jgi:hypothetical protein
VHHQSAHAAVDGSLATKWFDGSLAARSESRLVLGLPTSAPPVAAYSFVTANDNPKRDPTAWTFEVHEAPTAAGRSGGGGGGGSGGSAAAMWRTLDVADGVAPPDERRSEYARRAVVPGLHEAVAEQR